MPTIDATLGGASANSYVTRAEALTYWDEKIGADQLETDHSTDDLDRALITATRFLDARMDWVGFRADEDQALDWPRVDVEDEPIYEVDDVNSIPPNVKYAVFEFAQYLLESGDPVDSSALDSIRVGTLAIDFNEEDVVKTLIPDEVFAFVADYGVRRASTSTVREVPLYR